MLSFVTAPHAFWGKFRKFAFFFLLLGILAICVVYGIAPISWVFSHVPILAGLKNHRMILVASFCLAMLAGMGVSVLEDVVASWPLQKRWRAGMLAFVGFIIAFIMVTALQQRTVEVVKLIRQPYFSLSLLIAGAVPVFCKLAGGLAGRRFQLLLLGVLVLDLGTFSYKIIPFNRPKDVFPPSEWFERLKAQTEEPFRVAITNCVYGYNFDMAYGLYQVGGYEVSLSRFRNFLVDLADRDEDGASFASQRVLNARDRRLDMLNAKYFIISEYDPLYLKFREQPERFRLKYTYELADVVENLNALPAAFTVPATGIEVIPDESKQLDRIKDPAFNPKLSVVLTEAVESAEKGASQQSLLPSPEVKWISRRSSDFSLKVQAGEPSILVISQIYYPGWKAKVDGHEVGVLSANYALSAIPIASGTHDVSFSFEPASFKIGWRLSVLSIAVLLIMNCVVFIKRRNIPLR
jgi:hypothetical protein